MAGRSPMNAFVAALICLLACRLAILGEAMPAPEPAAPSSVSCTAAQFKRAITSCGYAAQPDKKRIAMLKSIKKLGGKAVVSTKRELAMYLAQVIHESGGLRYKAEIGGASAPYAPYYGRGYIQLTGRSNYAAASKALYGDNRLVKNPGQVATHEQIAWDVTSYYWKTRVHNRAGVKSGHFGATTLAINGGECTAGTRYCASVRNRCSNYKKVLKAFGVKKAANCGGCTSAC